MAKKQTFGDKVLKAKRDQKRMAKVVLAEKKPNGQYRFKTKMVDTADLKAELAAARS